MAQSRSLDLRERVVAAVSGGMSYRQAAERTVEGLWNKIGEILSDVTPKDCVGFFAAAGYEPI